MKTFLWALMVLAIAPAAHSQKNTTVHLYRVGSHGNPIQILVDGQKAFKISNHELFTFELSPGYHEVSASYAHQQPTVVIDSHNGDSKYLRLELEVRWGAMFNTSNPNASVGIALTKQDGVTDADKVQEHPLKVDQLTALLALRQPTTSDQPANIQRIAATPLPPLNDEQVRDALLEGAHNTNPSSIGLSLSDVQMSFASHALADGDYANSGFAITIYPPAKWIAYEASVANRLMQPFALADVTPEMRAMALRVVALPKIPDRLDAGGISAGSSVARIVLCDRSQKDIVQPLNERPAVVTVDSALRSKDYTEVTSAFDMAEVQRLKAADPKGEFFVVVIGQDGSRKFFDVRQNSRHGSEGSGAWAFAMFLCRVPRISRLRCGSGTQSAGGDRSSMLQPSQ
jgi:hypothetical protein